MQKCMEQQTINQINRIIGQLNGIVKVINTSDCGSVLMQLKAAEKSIKSVSIAVLKNHMRTCVIDGLKETPQETSEDFNKLLDRYL